MLGALGFLLGLVSLVAFALAVFLLAEVVGCFAAREAPPPPARSRGRIAVVIPAHNERDIVAATVAAVRAELRDIDRILVVADNCTDDTAALARPAGADAIERQDAAHCGKGYALQFGVDHLKADPPETVVFIDADCRPEKGAIARIADRAAYMRRPVQALYLMHAPPGSSAKTAVSAFAWLFMNRVRMSGLQQIAGVTRLTGSGMAFPWSLIAKADLASGEIVEDLALTIRFVEAGAPPFLDLGAVVVSELAKSDAGATTQRARWEHGSLRMALGKAPGLLLRGLGGDLKALALAFDIAIPPLTVFGAALGALLVFSGLVALLGAAKFSAFAAWAAIASAAAVILGWAGCGREALPPGRLRAIGGYILGKARVYGREGRRSARKWRRTERGDEGSGE